MQLVESYKPENYGRVSVATRLEMIEEALAKANKEYAVACEAVDFAHERRRLAEKAVDEAHRERNKIGEVYIAWARVKSIETGVPIPSGSYHIPIKGSDVGAGEGG